MTDLTDLCDENSHAYPMWGRKAQCEAMVRRQSARCQKGGFFLREGRRVCKHHAIRDVQVTFYDQRGAATGGRR